MKKEDLLAMGLTEEQTDKVMDGLNGDFVTKSRFNEVNTELKAARTALSERDKQLEELKKVDAAALQAQITQLQADNKQKDADYAAQLKALKISNAVELALTGAKAKNNTAAKALLADFISKAELTDDGTVKGLADEVKKLAAMPSKETLIAQVLYSFNYPIMQLAIACDAIVKKAEGNEEMKVAELVAPKEAAAEEAAE